MWFSLAKYAVGGLLLTPVVALGETANSNQLKNVLKAAVDIGSIQKKDGINGAMAVVKRCYDRELPSAKSLSPALEGCMTQDMLVSMGTAALYGRNTPENLKKMGLPSPDEIRNALTQRWLSVAKKIGLPLEKAREFSDLVNTKGLAEYSKVMTGVVADKY